MAPLSVPIPAPPISAGEGPTADGDKAKARAPRKARAKPAHTPVLRTDLLVSNLTARKADAIHRLMDAWRETAVLLGREQWRLFFETGRFNKNHDVDKVTFKAVLGAANRVQMCRYTVVGQMNSWLSNRVNDFRDVVVNASLDDTTRHMLHVINVRKAWFSREPLVMPTTAPTMGGEEIPKEVRALARTIMRHVMSRHRKPDLSRLSMVLDHRAGALMDPKRATQKGRVGHWVRVSTMTPGQTLDVPLLTHAFHKARVGTRAKGIQINRNRDGHLSFGVVTDIGVACALTRTVHAAEANDLKARGTHRNGTAYHEAICLDFGLSTLFGTSEGQLLGQNWLKRLKVYDQRITNIARGCQKRGIKPRSNKRYREAVQDLRGFITTETNRVLNRLVRDRKPMALVLERLNFQNPMLSRRLNRLLSNCGRSVLKTKLEDIKLRYGIAVHEMNPAYTSQECASCGYTDKRNRTAQQTFCCLWCGAKKHADLNAASTLGNRRALPYGLLGARKADVLADRVRAFGERQTRSRKGVCQKRRWDPAADPRDTNPYFLKWKNTATVLRGSKSDETHQGQNAALDMISQ